MDMKGGLTGAAESGGKTSRSRSASLGLGVTSEKSCSSKNGKKKSSSLPPETVEYLKNWIMSPEHIAHPYPTEQEKAQIMKDTGIEMKQLTNWFVNNRKRYWKPRVEARLREQQKAGIKAESNSNLRPAQLNNLSLADVVSTISREPRRSGDVEPTSAPSASSSVVVVSPGPIISAQSSVASEPESLSSSESSDDLLSTGQTTEEFMCKKETIRVHILRPVGSTRPTIEDVTVLPNIPSERTLRTFNNCVLSYGCAAADAHDSKKMQRRRDAEIVRIKKNYLKLYLSELADAAVLVTPTKRKRVVSEVEPPFPRPKFRRASVDLWKEACQSAGCVYDKELPSLEEATTLFGYAVKQSIV